MTAKMIINAVEPEEYRVAFVKNGILDGFHMETSTKGRKWEISIKKYLPMQRRYM